MNTRDSKGRFTKKEEENYLKLTIPSLKTIFSITFLIIMFMPWIIIVSRFHPFDRIEFIFEHIMGLSTAEETDTPKKNGLFY